MESGIRRYRDSFSELRLYERVIAAMDSEELTTQHVRRAREGDAESIEWLVERLSPLLLADARYRMGRTLRELYDPEDIVQDVWAITLPRLLDLTPRGHRYTPVLLKFLSTALIRRINGLMKKHIIGKPRRQRSAPFTEDDSPEFLATLPDKASGVISRLARQEAKDAVTASLETLALRDREILILRGVEQQAYKDIAAVLKRGEKGLAMEYHRALQKIRSALPGSIFDDFVSSS